MIMNDFGYIALTRMRAADQKVRHEPDQLIRTARRTAKDRGVFERIGPRIGPVQRLRQLARTLAVRPERSVELSRAATPRRCDPRP